MKLKANYIIDDFINIYEYVAKVAPVYYDFLYFADTFRSSTATFYPEDQILVTDIFII